MRRSAIRRFADSASRLTLLLMTLRNSSPQRNFSVAIFCLALALHPGSFAAEDRINYSREISRTADSLDELLRPDDRIVVSIDARGRARQHKVKALDRSALTTPLAYMLNMPKEMFAKAFIQQKYSMSDILFARHLSERQSKPFEAVLTRKSRDEWLKEIQKAGIPLKEVLDNFDSVYAEVAFRALNDRKLKNSAS